MFQITGRIAGKTYTLKFRRTGGGRDDYILSGDDTPIEKILAESKIDHGLLGLIPSACFFEDGYFWEETAVYALATGFVFDKILKTNNDWEEFDENAVY
jgi:hypothetical protein